MKSLSRVVCTEGMYLGPHHFRAPSSYFEDSIRLATGAPWSASYGVAGCEFTAEAPRNGTAALVRASGIFPGGLIFHMPDSDPMFVRRCLGLANRIGGPVITAASGQPVTVRLDLDLAGGQSIFQKGFFQRPGCVADIAR